MIPNVGELSGTQSKSLIAQVRAFFEDTGLDYLDSQRLKTSERFLDLGDSLEAKFRRECSDFFDQYPDVPG